MDYFYNSEEFFNRAKLSERDIEKLYEYIFLLSGLYSKFLNATADKKNIDGKSISSENSQPYHVFKGKSDEIENSYLLKLAFKYLKMDDSNNSNENLYIIEKIGKLYILSGNYRGLEFIKKYMNLEYVIAFNKKMSTKFFREKLLSIIGEKLRTGYLSYEDKIRNLENHGSIL